MPSVTVTNLSTLEEKVYSCTPREAVIAAHAQERGDYNTWQYADRYGKYVADGDLTVACGNWCAFKEPRP